MNTIFTTLQHFDIFSQIDKVQKKLAGSNLQKGCFLLWLVTRNNASQCSNFVDNGLFREDDLRKRLFSNTISFKCPQKLTSAPEIYFFVTSLYDI